LPTYVNYVSINFQKPRLIAKNTQSIPLNSQTKLKWGQLVFESTDIEKGWDGTVGNTPQPVDVYAYVLLATFANGKQKTLTGNVSLLR